MQMRSNIQLKFVNVYIGPWPIFDSLLHLAETRRQVITTSR